MSGKSIDRKECHQKLQKSSCNPGNQGLEINKTPIRNSGYSFSEWNQDPSRLHLSYVLNFFTLLSDSQCGLQCLEYNSQYAVIFC